MVYEFLVPNTSHYLFTLGANEDLDVEPDLPSTLMKQTFSTAILATCSMVRAEAEPIMLKKLAVIEQQPLRILCNMGAFPNRSVFQKWVSDPSRLAPLLRLARSHWSHILHTPRTLQNPHHVEFAVNSFQTFHPDSDVISFILSQIWHVTRISEFSCAIYHKGVLPTIELSGTVTGMWFWNYLTTLFTTTSPLPEGTTRDSIVKIVELKDEEWDRMVKEWRMG